MSEGPTISVLLPVYNGGEALFGAVRSILAQTYGDFEILLIDDGSTDGAVAKAGALDPRLRVIGDRSRRGLAARLNEGVMAARGKYIARMDADDLAFPRRFEKQAAFLDAHPDIDLAGCRAVVFREDGFVGMLPFAARHEDICANPWRGFPLPHPTWMGRAAWFRRFPYAQPEVKRAEDQDLLLRSFETSRFACLDETLLAYRQGKFNFGKTFVARRHLLAAQMRYFAGHGQSANALLALAAAGAKIAVDLAAALPGCEGLFFARMKGTVPDEALREFRRMRPGART